MKPANLAPIYVGIYPELAEVCREHGYALAVHGSLARDFDVIAIPWTADASNPEDVIATIASRFAITSTKEGCTNMGHGRIVYTLYLSFGECFLDFSFMPVKSDLQEKYDACHAELLAIHTIGMCIEECPETNDKDTRTVRMVRDMATHINNHHKGIK